MTEEFTFLGMRKGACIGNRVGGDKQYASFKEKKACKGLASDSRVQKQGKINKKRNNKWLA